MTSLSTQLMQTTLKCVIVVATPPLSSPAHCRCLTIISCREQHSQQKPYKVVSLNRKRYGVLSTFSPSHSHTHSPSPSHSLTHTYTLYRSLSFTHICITNTLFLPLTHTHTHTHSLISMQVPREFSSLIDHSLFRMDLSVLPDCLQSAEPPH